MSGVPRGCARLWLAPPLAFTGRPVGAAGPASKQQVKKFTVLKRNFTIEDGELTPTLKVKRKQVNEHFSAEIEAMYAESESAQASASA